MLPSVRGPLRAVHNNNCSPAPTSQKSDMCKANNLGNKLDARQILPSFKSNKVLSTSPEENYTPCSVQSTDRASWSPTACKSRHLPLRTSTYRTVLKSTRSSSLSLTNTCDYHQTENRLIDIRKHFPVRGQLDRSTKIATSSSTTPKMLASIGGRKRDFALSCSPIGNINDIEMLPQAAPVAGSSENLSSNKRPRLAMGSDVKAHPRYVRQVSFPQPPGNFGDTWSDNPSFPITDSFSLRHPHSSCQNVFTRQSSGEQSSPLINQSPMSVVVESMTTTRKRPSNDLSAVCPVPLPAAFSLPNSFSSNMVDSTRRRYQSAETQTSPVVSAFTHQLPDPDCVTNPTSNYNTDCPSSASKRSRRLTRSPSMVITSIKKTFCNLRRVLSSERLNASPSRRRSATLNSSSYDVTRRRSSIRSLTSYHGGVECSNYIKMTSSSVVSGDARVTSRPPISCNVTRRYSDGSFRVNLRRQSTDVPFGFCVARGPTGSLYINRLTDSTLKSTLNVGDRIVKVQNLNCTNRLEVADLKNLIAKCELVEMRVKPKGKGSWC